MPVSPAPPPDPGGAPPGVPGGHAVLADLSGNGRVLHARRDDRREVVLRCDPDARSEELRAELRVLAAVSHPGLARWIDHGVLSGGGAWIAREWIAGRDLATWAAGRPPEAVGAALAQVAAALAALHAAGLVHADLKPENVVVTDDADGGRPVVMDFGLAREADGGSVAGVAGTPYSIAPEVLFGGAPGPAADLFALGVLAHRLWVGERASAREFYARFPAEDFFEASATRPDDLPEWARDLVAKMLERDPAERPDAAEVARALAARLSIETRIEALLPERERPHWPVRRGREVWIQSALAELAAGERLWIRADAREVDALADALSVARGLAGGAVRRVDAERDLDPLADAGALDRWCRKLASGAPGVLTIARLARSTPWRERSLGHLARALGAAPAAPGTSGTPGAPGGIAVVAPASTSAPDDDWQILDVPPPGAADVASFLAQLLPGEPAERRAQLAARLVSSNGTAAAIEAALERACEAGILLPGADGWRLRPGRLPEDAPPSRAPLALAGDAEQLALAAGTGATALGDLADLAELEVDRVAAATAELVAAGIFRVEPHPRGARLAARTALPPVPAQQRERFRDLCRRQARRQGPEASGLRLALLHAAGDPAGAPETVAAELARLRSIGVAERAIELCDRVEELAARAERRLAPELAYERGVLWIVLGALERAEPIAQALGALGDARAAALAERLRGQVALARHDHRAAEEHLEAAGRVDPEAAGEAFYVRVRRAFAERRLDDVIDLVDALEAAPARGAELSPRWRANLRTLRAMAAFHRGDVDRARALLAIEREDAERRGDRAEEAGLDLNLATVERRAGNLERATMLFERSAGLHDACGLLPGLAQARAQLGGVLREAGAPARAETELVAAVELRERLGDRGGAAAARGMLGLARADRGHVRAALAELDVGSGALRALGRGADAELFDARIDLLRARIGLGERTRGGPARSEDPRIPLWRARAAWLRGDLDEARSLAARASADAERLSRPVEAAEAQAVGAAIDAADAEGGGTGGSKGADVDGELAAWLTSTGRDPAAGALLARKLEQAGRDDRAARAWLALAAVDAEARAEAERLFARCAAGLGRAEAATLRARLLSRPDPVPQDLWEPSGSDTDTEESDMEVLALLDINHQLLEQKDLDSLLGTIVEQSLRITGAERGFLVLEEEGELRFDRALDSSRGDIDVPDVEVSKSIVRRALDSMEPVRVSNAVDDPLLGGAPSVANLELRSVLCAPFAVQPGRHGVIYVDHRLRQAAFRERDQRVLGLLADQAGLAILQIARLEEIRRLNAELHNRVARSESDLLSARKALKAAGVPAPAHGLVGSSAAIRAVHQRIEKAAPTHLPVLVVGESGTGKELAARAIHAGSSRRSGPLVVENCAALPPALIESELFGYVQGAFTGAAEDRAGLFERAHGGTLFLDEIGELPLELQAKLLRVLETGEVRRIGDAATRAVDVRLVCATNRDLRVEVEAGRFRADLYYRLDGLLIRMPRLAERPEDVPELAQHFLRLEEARSGVSRGIAPAVLAELARRSWPGNVRELANEIARLAVLSEGDIEDPGLLRAPGPEPRGASTADRVVPIAQLERDAIVRALEVTGGDKRAAAEMLGISRAKIYQRLKAWEERTD